ncbi:uncharacterized protein LOC132258305 [Phlebotomus argentipes]|uniref:uncharacterized protein LOC132258305 n=1 Tax=Phlebotomus argentipes TaxID=94469 RepID=UPI002892F97B|nr:uncharacterized protein LOC132258305 [Phlebotomus argentipes]
MSYSIIEENITICWHDEDAEESTPTPVITLSIFILAIGSIIYCLCKRCRRGSMNQPDERTNIVGTSGNQTSARSQYFNLNELKSDLESDLRPIGPPLETQEQQNPSFPLNDPMPMSSMEPTVPSENPPPLANDTLNELQSDQRPIGPPPEMQEQQSTPHLNDLMPTTTPSMVHTATLDRPPPPAGDAKPQSNEQVQQVMGDKNG